MGIKEFIYVFTLTLLIITVIKAKDSMPQKEFFKLTGSFLLGLFLVWAVIYSYAYEMQRDTWRECGEETRLLRDKLIIERKNVKRLEEDLESYQSMLDWYQNEKTN
jgi:hypothetical protein